MTWGTNPDLVDRLVRQLTLRKDPQRAAAMAAYMRGQFPFLGVPSVGVKEALRDAGPGKLDEPRLTAVADALWRLDEREYQYAATALTRRFVKHCGPGFLAAARRMIVTKSWWDTVDTLASHTVGPLVRAHPELIATMDRWITDDNLWLARTALLHQLGYKQATDVDRLFRYCLTQAGHPDFFMRKAIGWALRQYAWVDPGIVKEFVYAHETELSGLSRREALKNV